MRNGRRWRIAFLALLVATLGAIAASCTARGDDRASIEIDGLGSTLREIRSLARDERSLRLAVLPGYADERWTRPFEQQTRCEVSAEEATDSETMRELLRQGDLDGISAPGDLSGLLMDRGDVAPIDRKRVPNSEQVVEGLANRPFNSREGQSYGVPHGRAANLLVYRTDALPNGTESWDVLWDRAPELTGRLSIYDSAIFIADAAVYLKATRPRLRFDDPYQLSAAQFRAARRLVRLQKPRVGEYWRLGDATQVASFRTGEIAVGTTRPDRVSAMVAEGVPVRALKPEEGTTGWSDTWMLSSGADNPNCMYLWMDYVLSPSVQALAAESAGIAPANLAACDLTRDPNHCTDQQAADEEWWGDVYFWTTPAADCGEPEGERVCVPFEEWTTAWWAELRR